MSCVQMLELLRQYVDMCVTRLSPKHGKMEELDEYYQVSCHKSVTLELKGTREEDGLLYLFLLHICTKVPNA